MSILPLGFCYKQAEEEEETLYDSGLPTENRRCSTLIFQAKNISGGGQGMLAGPRQEAAHTTIDDYSGYNGSYFASLGSASRSCGLYNRVQGTIARHTTGHYGRLGWVALVHLVL
jgi:hypothetical protein